MFAAKNVVDVQAVYSQGRIRSTLRDERKAPDPHMLKLPIRRDPFSDKDTFTKLP